jgi:hypothetical protein
MSASLHHNSSLRIQAARKGVTPARQNRSNHSNQRSRAHCMTNDRVIIQPL